MDVPGWGWWGGVVGCGAQLCVVEGRWVVTEGDKGSSEGWSARGSGYAA
jgi:hypothetical protein